MTDDVRGLHLHFDCASGVAGDMTLGALLDLGVPEVVVGDALDAIGAGRARLLANRVVRGGVAAIDVKVDTSTNRIGFGIRGEAATALPGDGGGGHAHHAHYRYATIRARIEAAALAPGVAQRALDIFDRIARAESKMHGSPLADVSFHEVGAIDSVVDVVGTAAALAWLAPVSASCGSVAMGSGTLTCAHGVLPVPAPAALEIMREAGGVMTDGNLARELCTPTGAAIVAATVTRWGAAPIGRAVAVGWGAGDAELRDRPNVLRVVAYQPVATAAATADQVVQIDANVDDMSPELCTPALDACFAAGALDAWWTPITMKKGRPALLLSALATAATRDAVVAAILRETTTIGVRFAPRDRVVLARRSVTVRTPYGDIPIKLAGDPVANAAPEYEACAAAAAAHAVPVKVVFAAAIAAYFASPR
nr:nickel pincer cofactor biosynthesis protein LarC [Kofleriaceae bacterium]